MFYLIKEDNAYKILNILIELVTYSYLENTCRLFIVSSKKIEKIIKKFVVINITKFYFVVIFITIYLSVILSPMPNKVNLFFKTNL